MSNLSMAAYLVEQLNVEHSLEKCDDFWIIKTKSIQFWYDKFGNYYGAITEIEGLE